jgi:hypothetical protein
VKYFTIMPLRTALVAITAAALCGSMLAASPANATDLSPMTTSAASPEQVRSVNALLGAVDQSTHTFDAPMALHSGAGADDVRAFANTWVALGEGPVAGIATSPLEVEKLRQLVVEPSACKGRNASDVTGLQFNFYFSSCKADELARAYGTGASSLAVVTAILGSIGFAPGAAGAAIIGAVLGLGAQVVNNCNARGRGIIVRAVPPAIWCNSQ